MACTSIICALNLNVFLYALMGGILPALLWLWFWMHEENDHHEPKSLIILTFLVGMAGVFVVFPLQQITIYFGKFFIPTFTAGTILAVTMWAFWEELIKYLAARLTAFKHISFVHPIDAFIYITTASLGFSAMENTILLLNPLLQGETVMAINAAAMRFMGASLLHFLASGIIALFIGLTFYSSRIKKFISLCTGFIIAIMLHSMFNFFIINNDKKNTLPVFLSVWVLVILLTISLERVKKIKNF
ncbi:PrsW family intramembrane metalloprotease [bacterium]|nr:PrsW family intramembrane metalloprotease [bacterium]